jgi:predicted RNA binding protein YcfA (HicA-like mRNA interferase family)
VAVVVAAGAEWWVMVKLLVGDDGLTRAERRRQLATHGWQLVSRDPATGSWQFRHRDGRQLVVPSWSEADAIRALLRQLQGETDAPTLTE